jgi:hypothetical protein
MPIYAGAGVFALAALLAGGWFFFWRSDAPTPRTAQATPATTPPVAAPAPAPVAAPTEGSVTVDSRPSGAAVLVDGRSRGVTPLQLTLPIGNHTLELGDGAAKRVVPITVSAGVVVSEHFDLVSPATPAAAPAAGAAAATTGRLEITSTPGGAQVTVDNAPRGVTPLTLSAVEPGVHTVVVTNGDTSVTQTINVTAGATSTVLASVAPTAANAGWVALKAPFELQVLEGGKLIGTSNTDRIMLPPGKHTFQLMNSAFGFDAPLTVQVRGGKTETPAVTLPTQSVSINVQPWADVWLDGTAIGTTPLANLSVAIGNHEIVWKNPQLGERRKTIAVTTQAPVRLGLDFNGKDEH